MFGIDRHTSGETATVTVRGELDLAGVHDVDASMAAALADQRVTRIVVDMSGLDLIDSCGIGSLVRARNVAIGNSRAFQVVNVGGQPDRVLRITGMLDALTDGTDEGAIQ
jgi:anti-anti-sigma factor